MELGGPNYSPASIGSYFLSLGLSFSTCQMMELMEMVCLFEVGSKIPFIHATVVYWGKHCFRHCGFCSGEKTRQKVLPS